MLWWWDIGRMTGNNLEQHMLMAGVEEGAAEGRCHVSWAMDQ
jgi:hypothetical protein